LVAWDYDVASGLFTFSDRYYVLHGTTTALEGGNRMSAEVFVRRFVHPDDAHLVAEEVGNAVTTADPDYRTQLEARILRRDGELRHVLVHISITKDAAGRTIQLRGANQDITERKRAQAEMENLHKQLLDASRQAGMAEIATNVLHNVGNVLNSVNISTGLLVERVKKSRASSLARVVVLLHEHAHDLGAFITNDSRGKHVPAHLAQLSEHLMADQEAIVSELDSLRQNVDHIKGIVAMQQNYAAVGGVKEMINVANLVEDSLRLNAGALGRHHVKVIREFETVPPLNLEKHKFLQIMVNLLRNAKHACQDSERADKRLTVRVANGNGRVRISVIDNGVGIPPENLTRIFNYGFTTRKGGHGFGLHSGALAANEMGGSLTVHSDGPGQGAAFTLELPCPNQENSHE
jgi:signal transduction histidine kinase